MLRTKLFDGLKRISGPFRTRNPHRDGARRGRGFRRPRLECLERRELLSLAGWAISFGNEGNYELGWDTAADASGNVYVSGRFEGTVDFDPDPVVEFNLTSQGGRDAFVAKYSPTGALIWAKSAGTPANDDDGRSIAVDGWGNATVTLTTSPSSIWHLDVDGNTLWSQAIVSTGSGGASDVAVDANGYIYIAGGFSETADFGDPAFGPTISLTSAGDVDVFVAKYAPSGEIIWAQRAGSGGAHGRDQYRNDSAAGIAVDGQDIYLTGRTYVGADFGSETVSLPEGFSKFTRLVFVAKMDAAGAFQWVSAAGGIDWAKEITVDRYKDVYITGGYDDAFAAKLDSSGNFLWTRDMGVSGRDAGYSVSADDVGNLYVVGGFDGTGGDYGPFELTTDAPYGAGFLAKLDAADGTVLSAQVIGWGIGGVSVGSDGALNYTGAIYTDASGEEFPTGETLISTPTTNGWPSGDIFVSKMEPGAPDIRSLAVSPGPVVQGDMLTLSAHGVLDIGGRVASVAFYRDFDGNGVLNTGIDDSLGIDNDVSNAWGVTVSTTGFGLGPQTYFAVATDNDGNTGEAAAIGEVVEGVPAQPETYNSTNVPKTIADPNKKGRTRPATSLLTPSGTGTVVDTVSVDLTIAHAAEAGLTVTLTSAQDTAASLTYAGDGVWQIDNSSAFQNENLDGTWKLTVTDTDRDGVTGTLQAWSMTVTPTVTPLAAAASPQSTAVDQALLAWLEFDSADDDDTDPLIESLVDDLALMLVE